MSSSPFKGKTRPKLHKQEVVASRGVIASNHPIASAAGAEMYSRGGNAFDAAISTLFALTVVEPMMVSIFGAGFFVFRDKREERIQTLDNYAVAPLAAKEDMYEMVKERKPGQNIFETLGRKNLVGPLSVATPGSLKAWDYVVKNYGELSLKEVLSPAIRLALEGFRASSYLSYMVKLCEHDLKMSPSTAETFLPSGKPLSPGEKVSMPGYAVTLEKIASAGSGILYDGELGKAVSDYMEEVGGLIALSDLSCYKLIKRDPVKGVYRDDYEIYSMAPGSSGGTHIIQMLNMLERYDLGKMGFGSSEYIHLLAEVMKIAFADRQKHMGDPMLVDNPVEGLTSKEYAVKRAREIRDAASSYDSGDPFHYQKTGGDTTHVSAMDSEGNIVAATQTLNGAFGSHVTVPGTGVLLNNCMALFDPRPGRVNSVAGGKRMLSSMSPTIIMRKGDPFICLGTPGGLQIFPSVTQAIINVIDFQMTLQEAVEAPRIWTMGIRGTPGENLLVESGFSEEVKEKLKERKHVVITVPTVAGGMNGVLRDPETGLLHGGACWRADGAPIGISGGYAAKKALESRPLI